MSLEVEVLGNMHNLVHTERKKGGESETRGNQKGVERPEKERPAGW